MSAVTISKTTDAIGRDRIHRREVGAESKSRWRSTGWAPLAYPASSLYSHDNISPNPFFPLHGDVLLATARELLILDGAIEGTTLEVTGVCEQHDTPSDTQVREEDDSQKDLSKRQQQQLILGQKRPFDATDRGEDHSVKKAKSETDGTIRAVSAKHTVFSGEKQQTRKHHVESTAEALADAVVKKSRILPTSSDSIDVRTIHSAVSDDDNADKLEIIERPPRKVSDSDLESYHPVTAAFREKNSAREISLFLKLSDRTSDGAYPFLSTKFPPLLEVSIVSETTLRDAAYKMVYNMTTQFSERILRLFLGYKSSAMKRDRLVRLLSEFLFDVSHAMFAWEQTELEILSERQSDDSALFPTWELDNAVKDSLFDERALCKIGGFDHSSLLPHAVSINRLRRRNITWKAFAKTMAGRKMLRHHRDGNFIAVGQKRRGQRLRPRQTGKKPVASKTESGTGTRSRSSSVSTESDVEDTKSPLYKADLIEEEADSDNHGGARMPNCTKVTLKKEVGKSWGVLLSKEGDMCVVVRAPKAESDKVLPSNSRLSCGDMILTVTNDKGDSASTPSCSGYSRQTNTQGWFKKVVMLFKTSEVIRWV